MKLILLTLLVAIVLAQDAKLLGERTATNFPRTWRLGAKAHPNHVLSFHVALKQRNLDILEEKFWAISDPDSPMYRQFMSTKEIDELVNPTTEVVHRVIAWLRSGNVNSIQNRGDYLIVQATVESIEKLLDTELFHFVHKESGREIIRQFGKYSVPAEVSEHVTMILGLSEFPIPKLGVKKNSMKRDVAQSGPAICPQGIQSYYGTGNTMVQNKNNSVGVIEFEDQYFAPSDLQNFAQQFNLQITPVTAAHTVGSNDPTNPQLEATLDIQYVLGVAINAIGWFWIENDGVWLWGFANHIYGTVPAPYVVSISYGWNEQMQCESGIGSQECQQNGWDSDQFVAAVNTVFQKIGANGVSLICASGDSGANGRTDPYCTETNLNPVFPAASPYITSCGATQIDATINGGGTPISNPPPGCSGYTCTGSGGYEEAVSYNQANFASGGGFSNVASTPAYQSAAVPGYLTSGVTLPPSTYFNSNGRGFPDVAAFGSNVLISSSGQMETVGGTSCASPIWGGIITLLNDYVITNTGAGLGFLNPLLYKIASNKGDYAACFNDITVGDNICTEDGCSAGCKGFKCATGWDPVTGLGSPKFPGLLAYVQKMLKIAEKKPITKQ